MQIIKTKTSDGIHLHGLISEPPTDKNSIIIHIHGRAGNIYRDSYYKIMHNKYPKSGWSFLTGENRGAGSITPFNTDNGSKVIGNAFEIFEECVLDIQSWVNVAKSLGYEKIWLQSHSLGASKVAYYIDQTEYIDVDGLIWLSPSDEVGLVHDPEGYKDHKIMFSEAKSLVQQNKDDQLLGHKLWHEFILSAKTYLNFFSNDSNAAIFNYNNLRLGWKIINSIELPVLAITGTEDDGIVPVMGASKAMKVLEQQLKRSKRVRTVVYQGAHHNFEGFEDNIVKDVLKFIDPHQKLSKINK